MSKKILVDAAHDEEIRLVLIEHNVVKSFYYHNKERASIKGNVYLARIARVEPSLQAAFVEYGENKQGFLPFSEIHPDYYQLPKDDKEELLRAMLQTKTNEDDNGDSSIEVESSEGDEKETTLSRPLFHKKYRIQNVIKKDQVVLVQILKEERGNKGVALTTYISLAGRYCVLLPNSTRAGGVSRRIEDHEERVRLKSVIEDFTTQEGVSSSVVIRTAGAYKTKVELKRDLSYLSRLWNNIREHTLSSIAPTFIHEEGDIIKKAIRDLYDNEVEEILVSGSSAYENARDFTKLLLPRHIDKVKAYVDPAPIFSKYGVEEQLGHLYNSTVQLDSGGYIVIDQTEALVAIDVNSGRFTKERSIESTALKNNLEAVKEIYRQVKLRDLSGLIVIDFIDMAESQNRKLVEKSLKEVFVNDKAKTQIGKISEFGLLEMSRQRLKQSFDETYMLVCQHCAGQGKIRPENVTAIAIMRAIENEVTTDVFNAIHIAACQKLILYMLNNKCLELASIERNHNVKIKFSVSEEAGSDGFFLEGIKVDDKPRKAALSGIDHAPYRLEGAETEEASGTFRRNIRKRAKIAAMNDEEREQVVTKEPKEREQVVTKELKEREQVVTKDLKEGAQEAQKTTKKSRYRKRFRANNVKISDDRSVVSTEKVDVNFAIQATAQNSDLKNVKNTSLLRDIWKKIMD